jgi:hypothetical protein
MGLCGGPRRRQAEALRIAPAGGLDPQVRKPTKAMQVVGACCGKTAPRALVETTDGFEPDQ